MIYLSHICWHFNFILKQYFKLRSNLCTRTPLGTPKLWLLLTGDHCSEIPLLLKTWKMGPLNSKFNSTLTILINILFNTNIDKKFFLIQLPNNVTTNLGRIEIQHRFRTGIKNEEKLSKIYFYIFQGIESLKKEEARWTRKSRWKSVQAVFGRFSYQWFSPFTPVSSPGVNFINILHTIFLYQRLFYSFSVVTC